MPSSWPYFPYVFYSRKHRMGSGMSVNHARCSEVAPAFDTQFDPVELIGTQIPFTDPFAFDDNDFRAAHYKSIARCPSPAACQRTLGSTLGRDVATLTSSQQAQRTPEAFIQLLEQCMPLLRTPSFLPDGPDVHLELKPVAVPGRVRLTPKQAIDIFKMRRTKKTRTAGLLAIKYGITPKAVRDIWTRKSWVKETRPHWNN